MIKEHKGNLLNIGPTVLHIAHICNLFHTFKGGIAKQIAELYPEAAEADRYTIHGDRGRIGTFTTAFCPQTKYREKRIFFNIYAMNGMGRGADQINYEGLDKALRDIEVILTGKYPSVLGIPKFMGAGLAGGDWDRILDILKDIFENSPVELHIVEFTSL